MRKESRLDVMAELAALADELDRRGMRDQADTFDLVIAEMMEEQQREIRVAEERRNSLVIPGPREWDE